MDNARIAIASLKAELKSIHSAHVLYWIEGAEVNRAARANYFYSQNRILEIRRHLVALNSALGALGAAFTKSPIYSVDSNRQGIIN